MSHVTEAIFIGHNYWVLVSIGCLSFVMVTSPYEWKKGFEYYETAKLVLIVCILGWFNLWKLSNSRVLQRASINPGSHPFVQDPLTLLQFDPCRQLPQILRHLSPYVPFSQAIKHIDNGCKQLTEMDCHIVYFYMLQNLKFDKTT